MRKKDPFGQYKTDPEDARLTVRVKPGEKGEWTLLGDEGIDNDNDGKLNEDGEGYVDGNRNWGVNWAPPYVQSGSGDYPFEAAGMRAIAKYLVDRPNILVVFAFHNNGGMYLRGPSTKAEEPMNASDVAVYDHLGKNIEKIVPGYRYLVSWKDLYATYGDFTDFTDNVIGAYSFVGELFVTESETFRPPAKPGAPPVAAADDTDLMGGSNTEDRERLKFSDNVAQGDLYKPWKPFKHPQFGDIEIGGWVKMSSRLPHPFMLNDLVHRNASAVLFTAAQTPAISLEVVSIEKMANDLAKVRVRVVNAGTLPSVSYNAIQRRIHPRDTLAVTGPTVKVVAGRTGERRADRVGRVQREPTGPAVSPGGGRRQGRVPVPRLRQGRDDAHLYVGEGGLCHQGSDAAVGCRPFREARPPPGGRARPFPLVPASTNPRQSRLPRGAGVPATPCRSSASGATSWFLEWTNSFSRSG